MSHIVYRSCSDRDVHGLVRMWKESRSGWPPGFFGASEISAASVEQEEKSSGRLFSTLALEDQRVVGYCRTCPYAGEPDASYVSLINVVPDRHGTGIGKALLLDAVSRSAEMDMNRIDLHTWPANMKAVPLYKKTGFFWVPDTKVYMQNYIPWLLRRKEFQSFLGGDDWYGLFNRQLQVEPDVLKTDSGREIFRYSFLNEGKSFTAEFDKRGRCPSKIEYPGFSAELSVSSGSQFFAGKPVKVSLAGTGFSIESALVSSADCLEWEESGDNGILIKPLAVRVPRSSTEPADRISVNLGMLELGIGVSADEEVALFNSAFRFLPAGAESVTLGVKSLGNVSSAAVSYSLNGSETMHRVLHLEDSTYQSLTLDLPPLAQGVHTMTVQIGRAGYLESVVLIAGVHTGEPVSIDTRSCAVIVSGSRVLTVKRRGGSSTLYTRDHRGDSVQVGNFMVCPGPPSWNSDLPLQRYSLKAVGASVKGTCIWPSKPGLIYGFEAGFDPGGYVELKAHVQNSSNSVQKLNFRARNSYGDVLEPKTDLIPVPEGLLRVQRIYGQMPDWDEDFSPSVSGLAAPWLGVSGGGLSVMSYFKGWTEFEYDMPGTGTNELPPGKTMNSPPFRILLTEGDSQALLVKGESLGWEVGDWHQKKEFIYHNLHPVLASGSMVTMTHPLHGERTGEIACCGNTICKGKVKRGMEISGELSGEGVKDVSLILSNRETVRPVFIVEGSEKAAAEENSGILTLSNSRIRALIDPAACGQIHSLCLDGVEYLSSAHPEPAEFAWEKPWFGGIHPRYMGGVNNRPYSLEKHTPSYEMLTRTTEGVIETGWKMTWPIDHRDFGSVKLEWTVWILPEIPVIRTELLCAADHGQYKDGEIDIRGFVKPGGSVSSGILTCDAFPGLAQGREHSGAWAPLGSWGRVQRDMSFVETIPGEQGNLLCEDYGELGCHFALYTVHTSKTHLSMTWILGSRAADDALAEVFRAYR